VRRFYDGGFKFYITGSNANLLSREIGTKLTGRHIDLSISPFSFLEYLKFNNVEFNEDFLYITEERASLQNHFQQYLFEGGIPEFVKYGETDILSRIYEDIIIKDIAVRYGITNLHEMRELYQYLVTNFANIFSFTKLKNIFGLGSVNTVKSYIQYLTDTFFANTINKFDYSLKKQIVNEKKLYVIDNGFIPRISTKVTKDKGWFLENLVFNELNKSHSISYYKDNKTECDFIVQTGSKITAAYQVCYKFNLENEKRESAGLLAAMNVFSLDCGTILTSDQEYELKIDDKKILVKPVWKWLLQLQTSNVT
ncbi:MAG: ATP-binding protein, partial [Ignavibacteria bacterium]|nr:ATP-binding protein [Ignavibacteria bacterium]